MQKAAVVGLGKSGFSVAKVLLAKGWSVRLWDGKDSPSLRSAIESLDAPVDVHLGQEFSPQESLDLVVVSPGVPWDHPGLTKARAQGIEVYGEVEFAWRTLPRCPWVCVTGTNGKTTTTSLLAAIFKEAGLQAPAVGNIGTPATEIYWEDKPDLIVAELSSFQIEAAPTIEPDLAIWTTFTPDHLNRHGTLEHYSQIKEGLSDRAKQVVLNGDDPYVHKLQSRWPEALLTSMHDPEAVVGIRDQWIQVQGKPILPTAEIQLPGQHNLQNVLMAVAAAHLMGIDPTVIRTAIQNFAGVPHRLETVAQVQGVTFINDSKATNYDAALVALEAMEKPTILLAGGQSKAGDPAAWLARIQEKTLGVVLFGEAAPLFSDFLHGIGYTNVQSCEDLTAAVPLALASAQKLSCSVVLLSPACASYDQYQNFEERGEHFRRLCQDLGRGS
jgi:UDP-N-acetylmuramoylalanine--D-glutamate ligase